MWESDDELNDEFGAQPPFIQVWSPVLPPIFSVFYFGPVTIVAGHGLLHKYGSTGKYLNKNKYRFLQIKKKIVINIFINI